MDSSACLEAIRSKILFTGVFDKNKMLNKERAFLLRTHDNRFLMSQSGLTISGQV